MLGNQYAECQRSNKGQKLNVKEMSNVERQKSKRDFIFPTLDFLALDFLALDFRLSTLD